MLVFALVLKYLLLVAVLLVMISTGLNLERGQFLQHWRRLTHGKWLRLLLATFIVPPALVLILAKLLPIGPVAMGGLYLVAVSPSAPLMTRNATQRGFDPQLAASYQMWGALLAPVMIPPLVGAAALLYGKEIWISPLQVTWEMVRLQFLPLFGSLAVVHWAPGLAAKLRRRVKVASEVLVVIVLILLLVWLGPPLVQVRVWLASVVLLLVAGIILTGRLLFHGAPETVNTLTLCNLNRNLGLALLLFGAYFNQQSNALPAIAAYALVAPLAMALYARWLRRSAKPATES